MPETILVPLYNRSSDVTGFTGCHMSWWLSHLYPKARDMVYFHLGTACHYAVEQNMLHNLSLDDTLHEGWLEYQHLLSQTRKAGIPFEGITARGKRSADTAIVDMERMVRKWWDYVHPEGEHRRSYFKKLDWPPVLIEHQIIVDIKGEEAGISTQVDAVFQGLNQMDWMEIVDWKSGGTTGTAKNLQIWDYRWGLELEGIIDPRQPGSPGRFAHLDFLDKPRGLQKVPALDDYGQHMLNWHRRTLDQKQQSLVMGPCAQAEWWCHYCPQRIYCPLEGEGSMEDVMDKLKLVEWLYEPLR